MKKLMLVLALCGSFAATGCFKSYYYDPELQEEVNELHKQWQDERDNFVDKDRLQTDEQYKTDYELGNESMDNLKQSIDFIFNAQKIEDIEEDNREEE